MPTEDDVYDEVEDALKAAEVGEFKAKTVTRKYAFEVKDVPRESDKWLKVVYGFDSRSLLHRPLAEADMTLFRQSRPSRSRSRARRSAGSLVPTRPLSNSSSSSGG